MKTLENRKAKRTRISRCKLSKKDQLKMIEFFALGITARSVADIMQMQPNTSALFYRKLREIISINLNQDALETLGEEFLLDEQTLKPYINQETQVVFGVTSRDGKVFTIMRNIVNNEFSNNINSIIPEMLFYINGKNENTLDVNLFSHEIILTNSESLGQAFWTQSKEFLKKYNGIPKSNFLQFLKECEFRFNYSSPKQQIKILQKWAGLNN